MTACVSVPWNFQGLNFELDYETETNLEINLFVFSKGPSEVEMGQYNEKYLQKSVIALFKLAIDVQF